ncbi:MarR family winged helix-turn-helix transcriptional regulator [Modestobacter sp. SSW1-42]|uniref:MarR family winged helix-turn-helix transcriptional regulator n=1 Tax=Modestobacter sp. SSW1-42 TaxID=596372 RepID=UPI003987815F
MDEGIASPDPPLARLLLLASRWFDARSRDLLEQEGWPRLSPAQPLLFAVLDEGGTPPAELARRLGNSRQATGQLIDGLHRLGLVELVDNPRRRGGRLVRYSARGQELRAAAYRILTELEASLGARRARTLRRLLAEFTSPMP